MDSGNSTNLPFGDNPVRDVWVFGYGSLVWKVDFPYETSLNGYIKGYERRFYQNSIDHRGTHDKVRSRYSLYKIVYRNQLQLLLQPGRVVTLIPTSDSSSQVWGVAYKLADSKINEVLSHLDYREKNGYERHMVQFYPYPDRKTGTENISASTSSPTTMNIIIYVANKDNESFAGPTDICDIANQIFDAAGPSGTNREYVYRLADAMRTLFPGQTDPHLYQLESMLREREKSETYNR